MDTNQSSKFEGEDEPAPAPKWKTYRTMVYDELMTLTAFLESTALLLNDHQYTAKLLAKECVNFNVDKGLSVSIMPHEISSEYLVVIQIQARDDELIVQSANGGNLQAVYGEASLKFLGALCQSYLNDKRSIELKFS